MIILLGDDDLLIERNQILKLDIRLILVKNLYVYFSGSRQVWWNDNGYESPARTNDYAEYVHR